MLLPKCQKVNICYKPSIPYDYHKTYSHIRKTAYTSITVLRDTSLKVTTYINIKLEFWREGNIWRIYYNKCGRLLVTSALTVIYCYGDRADDARDFLVTKYRFNNVIYVLSRFFLAFYKIKLCTSPHLHMSSRPWLT